MPTIINKDQFGFIKERNIGELIRFVQDLIENYENNDKEGIIIQLDFQKAFDSVEWPFLYETLRRLTSKKT